MRAPDAFSALARLLTRRPAAVLGVTALLAAGGGLLALGLSPSAGTDTLVGRSSTSYRATQSFHEHFGDEAVIVLVRGPLSKLVLTQDIERVLGLEGCLSGHIPAGVKAPGGPAGPCAGLARAHSVEVVYGPGTFINESARQIGDQFTQQSTAKAAQAARAEQAAYQLARAQGRSPAQARSLGAKARQLVYAEFTRNVLQLALRYGLTGIPRLNDPNFVSTLVFDATKTPGTPKARFAYLFPNANSALVQVRLRPSLTDAQRTQTIALVRRAVRMPQWALTNGGSYVVTGVPVIVSDLTASITNSILALLIASVLIMAATLGLVFRVRLRLLPLGVALAASA
ncbi:MAG TPA: MMPL family transporter, partial [Solirubrobacteraceae bacterium]|nr:MMPL family transporter [Solirubrobacteraceae bacterium]